VIGYIARRLAVSVVLLFVISVVTFLMYAKIPANPAGFLVDLQRANAQQIAEADHKLGVDRPLVVQYEKFLARAVHGDFGISWSTIRFAPVTGEPSGAHVGSLVWDATRVTASVVAGGVALLLLIALPLGAFVATRPGGMADRLSLALSLAAISTHPLVVGLLLQVLLGKRWHVAPIGGYCNLMPPSQAARHAAEQAQVPLCGGPAAWASHLALPWVTFALFFVPLYLRMVRRRMMDVLGEQYVRTARAKGASEPRVLYRHALRNAISPIVTMAGMDMGMAVGIALYVETVFGLPGLGRTTIAALRGFSGYDLPVIVAVVLVTAVAIVLLNLLVDLSLYAIDPTISIHGRKALGTTAA
jgi:peptide/nickel transport system permease protein